jgi:hypothetical protein
MAEQVRQRFVAAKLGVLLAIAGLVGGLTAKARTVFGLDRSSATPPRHEFVQKVKATIGSRQIIDGSLQVRDFKVGQVYSQSQVNHKFLKIDAASFKFLKIDGSAQNALKLGGLAPGDFLQGDGSVRTGVAAFGLGSPMAPVVTAAGFAEVLGVPGAAGGPPGLQLHNLSGAPLDVFVTGGGIQQPTVPAGAGLLLPAVQVGQPMTIQVVSQAIGGSIATFTMSEIGGAGGQTRIAGQVLVGTP